MQNRSELIYHHKSDRAWKASTSWKEFQANERLNCSQCSFWDAAKTACSALEFVPVRLLRLDEGAPFEHAQIECQNDDGKTSNFAIYQRAEGAREEMSTCIAAVNTP